MANSLTIRLCQEDEDESRNIALNPFVEALYSVVGGWHTIAQLKNFYNMTTGDENALDVLTGKITSTSDLTERMLRIHRIRSILTFWETEDISGYQTPDEVESQLSGIDQGP